MAAFWLFTGVSETIRGSTSGVINLILAIVVGFLTGLGWKRPLLAGILLSSLGVFIALYFLLEMYTPEQMAAPMILMCAPLAVGGLILIEADWTTRKMSS
jgi:hypothetical protein